MPYSFHFTEAHLPTQANLILQAKKNGFEAGTAHKATINDSLLALNETALSHLEHKHLLHDLITRHRPTLIPQGFHVHDGNVLDVASIIQTKSNIRWLLKPALRNNGDGIVFIPDAQGLIQHYQSHERYGGDHLLQAYIANPHLLNGHKYSIRMFIIVTHEAKAYLYRHGYMNIARDPYDIENRQGYLTNEHLQHDTPNVWQAPTERCPHFDGIAEKIKGASSQLMQAFLDEHGSHIKQDTPALAFLGADWMLDTSLKLWLLEVNHGPCFPTDPNHPLQVHLYDDFWDSVFQEIALPLLSGRPPKLVSFEPL